MLDIVRTVFGIRTKRRAQPSDRTPGVGSKIVRNDVLLEIQQPLNSELWDWMLLSGWRVNTVQHDRRKYTKLPHTALDQLIRAGTEKRGAVHSALLKAASHKN